MADQPAKPQVIGYAFEPEDMARLRTINTKLFGDGTRLTPDARRDLANLMRLVLDRAHPVTEADLKPKG